MASKKATASVDSTRFETHVMVHLDAAYNLARWLTRDDGDAEDLVQEACTRAFRFLETFRGGNSRAWFLAIVRNTYYSDRKKNRSQALNVSLDEESLDGEHDAEPAWLGGESGDPVREVEREEAKRVLRDALDKLPEEYREVIVLRELEELSYQEIARTMQIPIGTVMSRLSRARKMLYRAIQQARQET